MKTAEETLASLFGKNNDKLGRVLTFSLPAGKTCPGKSQICFTKCYARRRASRFSCPGTINKYASNLERTRRSDFARSAIRILQRQKPGALVRVHVSGDFYSARYTAKWTRIMRECPHLTFWLYTRSWRIPTISTALEEMAKLPNVRLWYSCDTETGAPKKIPKNVRVAYMQTRHGESGKKVDLYFREHEVRDTVVKKIDGTLVCPVENGVTEGVTCTKCRICFTRPEAEPARRSRDRLALSVIN